MNLWHSYEVATSRCCSNKHCVRTSKLNQKIKKNTKTTTIPGTWAAGYSNPNLVRWRFVLRTCTVPKLRLSDKGNDPLLITVIITTTWCTVSCYWKPQIVTSPSIDWSCNVGFSLVPVSSNSKWIIVVTHSIVWPTRIPAHSYVTLQNRQWVRRSHLNNLFVYPFCLGYMWTDKPGRSL